MTQTSQIATSTTLTILDPSWRNRLWNNLANVKFKALYTCECSRRSGKYGRMFSFVLAIASTSSAATWAFWGQHPFLLASVVALAQALQIGKLYIPFFKNEKDFLQMSFKYEDLYLLCEKLWFDYEANSIKAKELAKRFYQYRQRELDIEREHKDVTCPKPKRWRQKTDLDTAHELGLNFPEGDLIDDQTANKTCAET